MILQCTPSSCLFPALILAAIGTQSRGVNCNQHLETMSQPQGWVPVSPGSTRRCGKVYPIHPSTLCPRKPRPTKGSPPGHDLMVRRCRGGASESHRVKPQLCPSSLYDIRQVIKKVLSFLSLRNGSNKQKQCSEMCKIYENHRKGSESSAATHSGGGKG